LVDKIMASLNSEKIFVESSEEISFLYDRIVNSSKDYVVIVVTENSILFSSLLSLKILYRLITKLNKTVILVTEDKYGTNISQRAGFVVVQKVSQITSDLWEITKEKQFNSRQELVAKKDMLLQEMHITEPRIAEELTIVKSEVHADFKKDKIDESVKSLSVSKDEKEDIDVVEPSVDEAIIEEVMKEGVIEDKDMGEDEEGGEEYFEAEDELDLKKPKPKVKIVKGIKILGGGDIENYEKKKSNDKIEDSKNLEDMENQDRDIDKSVFGSNRYAGKDFTKVVAPRKSVKGVISSIFGKSKFSNPEDRLNALDAKPVPWYKKKFIMISLAGIAFVSLISYMLIFQWSSVTITVGLNKEEVVASESVKGSTTLTSVDLDSLSVPVTELKLAESISNTADATGNGARGDKARGFVYIFNKSDEAITLTKGTKFTNVANQLQYELVEDTLLAAATRDADQSLKPSRKDNILIEAVSYGEQYNIDASASVSFTVDGYEGISVLETKKEGSFSGGTTESFISVSEENIKALKQKIQPGLETSLREKIQENVPTGYKLIDGSIKFTEKKVTSVPAVNEESTNKLFDLTIELEVTAIAVKEDDLESIIETTIDSNKEGTKEIESLESIETKDYINNNGSIFFTVYAEGTVTNKISESDILDLVKGKSTSVASEILSEVEVINNQEVEFFPSFVPQFLKIVPNDADRVTIRFE
jgi:hypothetical protein